ncbi:MAG: isocitrate/isopropylmalate family dehydrogenase, partial [Pseudomonadota bacterium]
MKTYRIASIPGDGIGSEVISAGLDVLRAVADREGFAVEITDFDWGSERYLATGAMMPADGLDQLHDMDAIYFGSAGDPRVPDHISLWGLRLAICQPFDQYANVRPALILPGLQSPLRGIGPGDLDWVIVRENSEGEYAGAGGRAHQAHSHEVGMDVAVFTRLGVERIQRFAFELAQKRPAKHLTLVTKSNAQRHGMVMWDDVF